MSRDGRVYKNVPVFFSLDHFHMELLCYCADCVMQIIRSQIPVGPIRSLNFFFSKAISFSL